MLSHGICHILPSHPQTVLRVKGLIQYWHVGTSGRFFVFPNQGPFFGLLRQMYVVLQFFSDLNEIYMAT